MEKELFNRIYMDLHKRVDDCLNHLMHITRFDSLPISELKELKKWAEEEHDRMTTIAMVDLYHILGMGNLTAIQQTQFISQFKWYLSFRPMINTIITHFNSIDDIPVVPTGSSYRLHVLGAGRSLTTGTGLEVDEADVSDYSVPAVAPPVDETELPFYLSGDDLGVTEENLKAFYGIISKLVGGAAGTYENFSKKVKVGGTYFGISWTTSIPACTGTIYVGKVKSTHLRTKLATYQEAAKK